MMQSNHIPDAAYTKIRLGISQAFNEKTLRPGWPKSSLATSFEPTTRSLYGLVQHAAAGGAYTLARFATRRSPIFFTTAQLLGMEFTSSHPQTTVQALRQHPFIGRHAFFIYAAPDSTPDHPQTYVLFVLDSPITDDFETWQNLQRRFVKTFDALEPSAACKNGTAPFFGSRQRESYINYDAVLPLATAQAITMPQHTPAHDILPLAAYRRKTARFHAKAQQLPLPLVFEEAAG